MCVRGSSASVHVHVCGCMPLDVQCTYAGQHGERWQRKQTHAVAGLRVKLHGNTISSSSDASPLSVCPVYPYSLPSLSLSLLPSLYSSWQQLAD